MRIAHHLKQHILPTTHNGFVPKLLREKQVIGMLVIGLAAFSFGQYAHYTGNFGLTADVYPAAIVTLTNQDRQSNSLPTVTMSAVLQKVAQRKADDMAAKGYFAHTSPDGKTPWYWFAKEGYSFIYAGENLAVNFDDTGAVEDAWLNSPTHRANILNKNFTEMGVATATGQYNGRETTFVVEEFGMPAIARAATAAPTTVAPKPAAAAAAEPAKTVAGESVQQSAPKPIGASSHLAVLKETPTFSMAQNTDQNLEPGNPVPAPESHLPFYQRLLLHSDKVAGLILQIILILAIISVAGMVAREYEKHHRKHMAYGALIAVIMFTSLFVGRFGFFAPSAPGGQPLAAAPTLDTAVLQ